MHWHRVPRLEFELDPDEQEYMFLWNSLDDPYLEKLRAEFGLERVSCQASASTSIERILAICHWLRGLGRHNGSFEHVETDPRMLFRALLQGLPFRCVEYSIVVTACLSALGFASRIVNLKTKDVETRRSNAGHVVCEVFLREINTWVFVDPQACAVPLLGDTPLGAVRLQAALAHCSPDLSLAEPALIQSSSYFRSISRYLYYFEVKLDNRIGVQDTSPLKLMLVPIGASKPRVMQRRWPMVHTCYTHSLTTFYQRPDPAWL